MHNPLKSEETKMTSTEFEKYSEDIVRTLCNRSNTNFNVKRDIKLETSDGIYQIDIYVEHEFMGVLYKTLIECKKYSRRVEREKIVVLKAKLDSVGAQKGILFSTSGFQKGAIEYAQLHGIALIHIIDGNLTYESRSVSYEERIIPNFIKLPNFCGPHLRMKNESLLVTLFCEDCDESVFDYIMEEKNN